MKYEIPEIAAMLKMTVIKTVKNIALLLTLAFTVLFYAQEQENQLRTETEEEIASCGTKLAITEIAGFLTGILPSLAVGSLAANAKYNALAPLSTLRASLLQKKENESIAVMLEHKALRFCRRRISQ